MFLTFSFNYNQGTCGFGLRGRKSRFGASIRKGLRVSAGGNTMNNPPSFLAYYNLLYSFFFINYEHNSIGFKLQCAYARHVFVKTFTKEYIHFAIVAQPFEFSEVYLTHILYMIFVCRFDD